MTEIPEDPPGHTITYDDDGLLVLTRLGGDEIGRFDTREDAVAAVEPPEQDEV